MVDERPPGEDTASAATPAAIRTFTNALDQLAERVCAQAHVRSAFGEPFAHNGQLVIPVARVAAGFGSGGGVGDREQAGDREDKKGAGVGGGAGYIVLPLGVFEIGSDQTTFRQVQASPHGSLPFFGRALAWVRKLRGKR